MDDLQAFARQVFETQNFSRFIGAELVTASASDVEMALTIQDHHKQQHGFVHCGVISYLADNAITFGGASFRRLINALPPEAMKPHQAIAAARSAAKRDHAALASSSNNSVN